MSLPELLLGPLLEADVDERFRHLQVVPFEYRTNQRALQRNEVLLLANKSGRSLDGIP